MIRLRYDCSYRGCSLWDISHDHHIHPGDIVEWYDNDGKTGGRARVLACFMIDQWAWFDLGHGELIRYDRVRRLNEQLRDKS